MPYIRICATEVPILIGEDKFHSPEVALVKIEARFNKRYRRGNAPCYQKMRTQQQILQERKDLERELKRSRSMLDKYTKQLQSNTLTPRQFKYRQDKLPKYQHNIERLEALQEDLQRQENCILGVQTEQYEVQRRKTPNSQKEYSRIIPHTNLMLFGKVDGYDAQQQCVIEYKTRIKTAYHHFWPNEIDQVITYMWLTQASQAKLIEIFKNDYYEDHIYTFPQTQWDTIQKRICLVMDENFKFNTNGTLYRRPLKIETYFKKCLEPVPLKPKASMEATPKEPTPMEAAPMEPTPMEATPMEPTPMEAIPMEAAPKEDITLGFLYVVRAGRYMFIDWTNDVQKSLAALNIWNPNVIELQAVLPVTKNYLNTVRGLFTCIPHKLGWFFYDSTALQQVLKQVNIKIIS